MTAIDLKAGRLLLLLTAWLTGCAEEETANLTFQEERYCAAALNFLASDLGLPVRVDPDTIDDWRTGQVLPGCRIYASGATDIGIAAESQRFYDRLEAAGWPRTPDPRDSPNEASLRLRRDDADCLFHVYYGPRIGAASEIAVSNEVVRAPGEDRYNVLVQCMPAMAAAE